MRLLLTTPTSTRNETLPVEESGFPIGRHLFPYFFFSFCPFFFGGRRVPAVPEVVAVVIALVVAVTVTVVAVVAVVAVAVAVAGVVTVVS